MTGRTIKRQSTEKNVCLTCKRWYWWGKKSRANAAVEAEQEVYNEGKFEDINVVHNKYDHTKNINYHLEEVQNETLKEEILY